MQSSNPRVLFVVPPFAAIDRPSLGLHILQAVLKQNDVHSKVVYANIDFAKKIGELEYANICYGDTGTLFGEQVFSRSAWGEAFPKELAQLNQSSELYEPHSPTTGARKERPGRDLLDVAGEWTMSFANRLRDEGSDIVGFNLMFEQVNAACAIAKRLKEVASTTKIWFGGPLCDDELALGLRSLPTPIDLIFSGEAEAAIVRVLNGGLTVDEAEQGIVKCQPNFDLNSVPMVDYSDYFDYLSEHFPESGVYEDKQSWLPYEGSRGCWWGQKHHCTFCGVNGSGMGFREKSREKFIAEVEELRRYPAKKVLMVDNIMPHTFFKGVLKDLSELDHGFEIFYEQKANINFRKMAQIAAAGIKIIQPGIEALSDHALELMKKGVKSSQNIATLRYAQMFGIKVQWNLLYAMPGDLQEDYTKPTELIPFIEHLFPPSGLSHLSIDRFSPYFNEPQKYGIANVRPMKAYHSVFPESSKLKALSYHFEGDYQTACRTNPELYAALSKRVDEWRDQWFGEAPAPALSIIEMGKDIFVLVDRRRISDKEIRLIDRKQARACLVGMGDDEAISFAKSVFAVVEIENALTPLATCTPQLFVEFLEDKFETSQELVAV